jgi:hypothetical protein
MGFFTIPTLAFVFKINPIANLDFDVGFGLLFQ